MKPISKRLIAFLTVVFAACLLLPGSYVQAGFKDVPDHYWARDAIGRLAANSTLKGYQDGTFKPGQPVTRGQSAEMIAKAAGLSLDRRPDPAFRDVRPGSHLYKYAAALAEEGIIGNSDTFRPNGYVTRAQLSKMLVKAFSLQSAKSPEFRDIRTNHWARPFVGSLAEAGITTGKADGTFEPNGQVTRAQMATFLVRSLDYKKTGKPAVDTPSYAREVVSLVNAERKKKGLQPLTINGKVQTAAQAKAKDLRDHRYFSHNSPTYGSPFDMMKAFGIDYLMAGENIAAGQKRPHEVVQAWMDSPGHRENILTPEYNEIGVGFLKGGDYGYYWVQLFRQSPQ